MTRLLHGRIRGRFLELDEDTGMVDGEEVDVLLTPVKAERLWGQGILRSAGALSDEPDFDAVFNAVAESRRAASYRDEQS